MANDKSTLPDWHCVVFDADENSSDPEAFEIVDDLGTFEDLDSLVESLDPGVYGFRRSETDPWKFLSIVDEDEYRASQIARAMLGDAVDDEN